MVAIETSTGVRLLALNLRSPRDESTMEWTSRGGFESTRRKANNPFLSTVIPSPAFEEKKSRNERRVGCEEGVGKERRSWPVEDCIDGASWLEVGDERKESSKRKQGEASVSLESLVAYSNRRRARRSDECNREVILCVSDDEHEQCNPIGDVVVEEKGDRFSLEVRRAWLGAYHTGSCRVEFSHTGMQVTCVHDKELDTFVKIEDVKRFGVHYTPQIDATCGREDKDALVVLHLLEAPNNLRKVLDLSSDSLLNSSIVLETNNKEYVQVQRNMLTKLSGWQKLWSPVKEPEAMEVVARLENHKKLDVGTKVALTRSFYFPSRSERDAVKITNRDLKRLRPTEFVNDTIIDFYIKYLQQSLDKDLQSRFHFFSSFFYKRLITGVGGDTPEEQMRLRYEQVQSWTRDVDIFEKNYLVVPVNDALHWSLIVVCNPGMVTKGIAQAKEQEPLLINDEVDVDVITLLEQQRHGNFKRMTCILHFDSMNGGHGDMNVLRKYLSFEWANKRQPIASSDNMVSFEKANVPLIRCKVPLQTNFCDCGLFLLHYLELFLKEAPECFSMNPEDGFPYFLTPYWFPPSDASKKRNVIRDILLRLSEIESNADEHSESVQLGGACDTTDEEVQCMEGQPSGLAHVSTVSVGQRKGIGLEHREHVLIADPSPSTITQKLGGASSQEHVRTPEVHADTPNKLCLID